MIKLAKNSVFLFVNIFLEIFFPKRCVECGSVGREVCYSCISRIEKVKTDTCPDCGKISPFSKYCPRCKVRKGTYLTGIMAAASYEAGPVKEMIHHLKYTGITGFSDALGELLAERLRRVKISANTVVIPVPLHKKRLAERGFNQSELLARYISKRLDLPGGDALERVKNTESQVKLTGEKRRKNLTGAFECKDPDLITGKTVLLVDDVTTTGSTLNECAKVLRENGAKKSLRPCGGEESLNLRSDFDNPVIFWDATVVEHFYPEYECDRTHIQGKLRVLFGQN